MLAGIMENFDLFWQLFNADPEFNNRQRACRALWEQKSEQTRQEIIKFLQSGGQRSSRNPYYFIADFRVRPPQTLSYADYYARFGTTEEREGWKRTFLPDQQKTIYIKQ